jgi:2-amino-4-hydroxy-6-hydroxymethyldihydropteridine diphosphokinase
MLSDVRFTSAIWTEPYRSASQQAVDNSSASQQRGSEAAAPPALYLNQIATANTDLGFEELCAALKQMEISLGRTSEMKRKGQVCIDLDILLYDDDRYHEKDWQRPYVADLLKELSQSAGMNDWLTTPRNNT